MQLCTKRCEIKYLTRPIIIFYTKLHSLMQLFTFLSSLSEGNDDSDMKKDDNLREKFALCYHQFGNAADAAVSVGIDRNEAQIKGALLLLDRTVRKKLKRLRTAEDNAELVKAGLRRLAFGSANDAVRLIFADEDFSPQSLCELNLFNVSEIKSLKGGGFEIKLFDRQKALEKLFEIDRNAKSAVTADSFFTALSQSAEKPPEEQGESDGGL